MNNQPIEDKITQALDNYPLAELPPDFTERVMTRVQVTPQDEKPRPAFLNERIFLPAALVLFAVVFTGTLVWVSRMLMSQINPLLIAYYKNVLHYWQLRLDLPKLSIPMIYITLTSIAVAIYGLVYLLTTPRRESH